MARYRESRGAVAASVAAAAATAAADRARDVRHSELDYFVLCAFATSSSADSAAFTCSPWQRRPNQFLPSRTVLIFLHCLRVRIAPLLLHRSLSFGFSILRSFFAFYLFLFFSNELVCGMIYSRAWHSFAPTKFQRDYTGCIVAC